MSNPSVKVADTSIRWTPDTKFYEAWEIEQHTRAINAGTDPRESMEQAMATMLRGWILYAETYAARYESPIGGDHYIGPEWEQVGRALLALLNGETGRLHCGTLDHIIRANLTVHGPFSGGTELEVNS